MADACPQRHATRLAAEHALRGEARRLRGRKKVFRGERLTVWRCARCAGWHVTFRWLADSAAAEDGAA